jgi:hypothetical protein
MLADFNLSGADYTLSGFQSAVGWVERSDTHHSTVPN